MQAVSVNYWAVLVCGIASMVLGFLYFGPLFGKLWMHLIGMNHWDDSKKEAMKKSMNKSYGMAFVGALVMAWVLAHAVIFAQSYLQLSGLSAGLTTGFMSWLGFVAPVTLGSVLWEGKSGKLWTVSNGHMLIQLLIFGAILGTWR